jgi:site-specific DNA-cytosine methylase
MKTKRSHCVLSAFTGAGGLDLGFEAAGFEVLLCVERDRWSRMTITNNRPAWPLAEFGDIEKAVERLTPGDLGLRPGELSVLVAGPPCQPFSKAAQWSETGRSGMKDPRAACLGALLDLVDKFLPEIIFMENVIGFTEGPSSARAFIEDRLARINKFHRVRYRLLEPIIVNAADFGVPQKRQRALLVALRDGGGFLPPSTTSQGRPVTAWDAIGGLSEAEDFSPPKSRGKWSDLLASIPEGKNYLWHTPRGEGMPIFGYRTRYWSFLLKLAKSSPAWTLSAAAGPSTGPFHWENRPLAIEEALRLQTFPANWRFYGSHREQIRQVGNATPPLLSENFARAIGQQFFGMHYDNTPLHSIPRRENAPPPCQVAPVPPKYLNQPPFYLAHPGVGKGPKPAGTLKQRLEKHLKESIQ